MTGISCGIWSGSKKSPILSAPGLKTYLRFDDPGYLYQSNSTLSPVSADGQTIGLAVDLSGNGFNASQATSTKRPLWRSGSGLGYAEFDGTDDHFLIDASLAALGVSTPFTAYIVADCTDVAATRGLFGQFRGATATNVEFDIQFTTTNNDFLLRNNSLNSRFQYGVGGGGANVTGKHLWTFQRTAANSYKNLKICKNNTLTGSQVNTLATYSGSPTQASFSVALGARSDQAGSTAYWLGKIYALVFALADHDATIQTEIYQQLKEEFQLP